MTTKTEDRLIRARIKLQSKNPFFSYLSLFLKFQEDKEKKLDKWAGMGVNSKGELIYNKEFVDNLSEEELKGVLSHEILHLALLHLLRLGNKDRIGWNIACDLCVNSILRQNRFSLPSGSLIPNYDNSFEIGGVTIEKINEKTVEEIYNELPKQFKQNKEGKGCGNYKITDDRGNNFKGFDKHIDSDSEGITKEEKEKLKEGWKEKVSNAYVSAKQRGNLPLGLERLIGKLHKEQIDWKTLLKKHLLSFLPVDYSYHKPSKKSVSCGYYMPNVIKDKIKVVVAIDTSGSISQKDLVDFLSEIVGIARAYQNQIDMTLYTHDTEIHDRYEVRNGNIQKIMQLKISGGGGTSHKSLMETINKEISDCKCAVFFSDCYSDLNQIDFNQNKFHSIFVINKNGSDGQLKDKTNITKIKIE